MKNNPTWSALKSAFLNGALGPKSVRQTKKKSGQHTLFFWLWYKSLTPSPIKAEENQGFPPTHTFTMKYTKRQTQRTE